MSLFLSSDYHLQHDNIRKYCNRPFKDLESHDEHIIRLHNSRIKDNDTFIHGGDLCFKNSPGGKKGEGGARNSKTYLEKLNGIKILICGNHDKNNGVKTYIKSLVIEWGGNEYFIVHRPEDACKQYPVNFVGHVHNNWVFYRKRVDERYIDLINIGIDVWGFMPRKIEEILKEYYRWTKTKTYKTAKKNQEELKFLEH